MTPPLTIDQLQAQKAGRTISVVLPARNEAASIGSIVSTIKEQLVGTLVDELIVMDDQSSDDTARIAADAGAVVHQTSSVLEGLPPTRGKGSALWRSLAVTTGDLIAWCDADIVDFDTRFILGPLTPLLTNPDVVLTKASYLRPPTARGDGGGRVTELLARPLLATLHPELLTIRQPLGGEFAGRRDVLEAVPFWSGYAVDLGLLLEVSERFGPESIVSVDLGERHHRNRSLHELGPQATEILSMVLSRSGVPISDPVRWPTGESFREVEVVQYPPMNRLNSGTEGSR